MSLEDLRKIEADWKRILHLAQTGRLPEIQHAQHYGRRALMVAIAIGRQELLWRLCDIAGGRPYDDMVSWWDATEWAMEAGLVVGRDHAAAWVVDLGKEMIRTWSLKPWWGSKDGCRPDRLRLPTAWGFAEVPTKAPMTFWLGPLQWRFDVAPARARAEVLGEVRAQLNTQFESAKHAVDDPKLPVRAVVWFVRYQFMNHTLSEISETPDNLPDGTIGGPNVHISKVAVHKGIRSFAALVGIRPKAPNRPGRPAGSKTKRRHGVEISPA
jgi:hypothetical protein